MNYTNSQVSQIIDEYIHSATHREMIKKRLIDGLTYAEIAEEFHFSIRQTQRIIYKLQKEVFKRL